MSVQSEPIRELQDVLQILDDGAFASTYKFAVLLGLIDACVSGAEPDGTGRTAEMALPKLQRIGGEHVESLYRIHWTDQKLPARRHGRPVDFDNRILLLPGVASAFVSLSAVLRPFIQQKWTAKVSKLNKLPEHKLDDFLLGCERSSLDPVRDVLATNQDARCFYCDGPLSNQFDIDRFLPWSRHPSNDLANLVAADKTCNQKKSDFLPAVDHIAKWRERPTALLQSEAAKLSWTFTPEVELASARALYKPLTKDVRLWRGREVFEPVDLGKLAGVLGRWNRADRNWRAGVRDRLRIGRLPGAPFHTHDTTPDSRRLRKSARCGTVRKFFQV